MADDPAGRILNDTTEKKEILNDEKVFGCTGK
jgi:hypothetical protein